MRAAVQPPTESASRVAPATMKESPVLLLEANVKWCLGPNDGGAATMVLVQLLEGLMMTVGVLPNIGGLEVNK